MFNQTQVRIKAAIDNLLGIQINLRSRHGHYDCHDIKRSGSQISVIFDVGAHTGESALKFSFAFPKARIYCFEPVRATFEKLKRNLAGYKKIICHNLAFGSSDGKATVYLTERSTNNSLLRPEAFVGSESVAVRTLDGFTAENQIGRIDLLKVDTEGFDLEVLKGARNMLSGRQIPFVITEIGFHPQDTTRALFDDVRAYLLALGYAVFGIYDQQPEWSGEKRLRFANACFCKESALVSRGQADI